MAKLFLYGTIFFSQKKNLGKVGRQTEYYFSNKKLLQNLQSSKLQ